MSKQPHLLPFLRSRWEEVLRIEEGVSESGFIGPIPHLLLLRWFVLGGILLRFGLLRGRYADSQRAVVLLLSIMTVVLALAASYVTIRPNLRRSRSVQVLFIGSDIVLISLLYLATIDTQSDFFLFYFLPIFAATEYLGTKAILTVFAIITCAFASVLVLLLPTDPTISLLGLFLRVFLPREIFFLSVIALSAYLRRLERTQKETLARREAEVQTLLNFKAEVDELFDVDRLLELTVHRAVKSVGARGGHISLVDFETNQLELRSYTPQGYLREEAFLALGDGPAKSVIERGESRRLEDVQSDPILSRVFDSSVDVLLYVPITVHNTVIGVLGVGALTNDGFGDEAERFLQALAGQVATTIERDRLLTSLHEVGAATASALELDLELNAILGELTETLGFDFATISLVDGYRHIIEMVRGKNVPSGWIRRSKYGLDSPDILADIARTGKTEVIEAWDERFNPEIYGRFGHENFVRIFVPLVAGGVAIGTIEAGCRRERRTEIITSENVQAVDQLGKERGKAVARSRPYVLLEMIASRAIKIIGADSASLHVYQFNELILEAGAGRATKAFLHKFPPRDRGIGQQAMRTGKYVVIDRPQDLASKNKHLYEEGVRAIAAFPLSLGAGVLGCLYVHFWREHRFSPAELELERVFARQMEVAVQDSLLLKGIAEAAERAWTISGMQNLIQSLASGSNLAQVLEEIAQNVLYILDADNVTLYQYFQEDERFEAPPVMTGTFVDEASMQTQTYPDDIIWRIVRDGVSRFITDVSTDPVLSGARTDGVDRLRFVEREAVTSCAVLVLRAGETNEIVGLLFVNYRTPNDFDSETQKTIIALASSAAIAIRTARLIERVSQDLIRRDRELEALHAVDEAIVVGAHALDLRQILELILGKGLEIIGAPAGEILQFNQWGDVLELVATRGFPEGRRMLRQNIGEGIVGLVAERRETILASDVTAEEWADLYDQVIPETRSEIAVPLIDESGLLGVLNVEHPEVGAFNEDDRVLLETLAVQVVIAIHIVDLYQKLESHIKSLRSLTVIATRIQDVRYDLDTVLRLLLTGLTAGDGVGYSRAMIFLADGERNELHGGVAVGARTREEAETIWEGLDEEIDNLRSREKDVLTWLLDQAEKFSIDVREGKQNDSPLSTAVRGISLRIEESVGAISECVLKGKPVIVHDNQSDLFRNVIEQVSKPGDMGHAFVCVPLVGKGKTIGVLVVDNRFLISEREIDESTLSSLEAFAGVAAMSIENAQLRARLAEERRLEDWKSFTARVAHITGTRIAVIGGTATQLNTCLLDEEAAQYMNWEAIRTYLSGLTDGIRKAKVVLKEFREFATPSKFEFEELDIAQLLENLIRETQHSVGCPIELALPSQPVLVRGDPIKLSDAFTELITNARQSMQQDTGRPPLITIAANLEAVPTVPKTVARIEFVDTGPGVPEKNKNRVFEPFFSTKPEGSGLGLAIVKDILEEHNGRIEEAGMYEVGARFIVRLPTLI